MQVVDCIERDEFCSPYVDRIQMAVGSEYEYILQQALRSRGVHFYTEGDLRCKGFSKTPDVLLKVPIGVRDGAGRVRIVHWVDSKATFGDKAIHETEISLQLNAYVNRFGPGAVIYWFDYVDTLPGFDPNVLVLRDVPTEFVTLAGDGVSVALPATLIPTAGSDAVSKHGVL